MYDPSNACYTSICQYVSSVQASHIYIYVIYVCLRRVANQVGFTQIDSYLMDTHVRADATCEPISTKNQTCMNVISSVFFATPQTSNSLSRGGWRGVAKAVVAGEAAKPNVMFAAKNKHDFFIRQIPTYTHTHSHMHKQRSSASRSTQKLTVSLLVYTTWTTKKGVK